MSVLQQMMPHPPFALLRAGPRMRNFPGCSTQASGIRDGTGRALVSMEMNLGLLGWGVVGGGGRDCEVPIATNCYLPGVEHIAPYPLPASSPGPSTMPPGAPPPPL